MKLDDHLRIGGVFADESDDAALDEKGPPLTHRASSPLELDLAGDLGRSVKTPR